MQVLEDRQGDDVITTYDSGKLVPACRFATPWRSNEGLDRAHAKVGGLPSVCFDFPGELIVPLGEIEVGVSRAVAGRPFSRGALLGGTTPEILHIALKHVTLPCPEHFHSSNQTPFQ